MARKSYQRGCLQWHNDQWTLVYWLKDHTTGKRVQKRECAAFRSFTDYNDKKAALEAAIEFLRPINKLNSNPNTAIRKDQPDSSMTFAQFIKTRWASYVKKRSMEPSTVVVYNSHINKHLLPALGDLKLREITTGQMTDFFDSLYGNLKESTIANIYRLLNLMFDIALDYDLIESKPLRKKLHKPEFEREEKPIMSVEAIRRLLKGLSYSERLFIAVLAVLTIRVNEGAALRWMNIDFESGLLSLTHGVFRRKLKPTLKTKASRRKFELPEPLLDALRQWRARSPFYKDEDFIFANSVGNPLDPDRFLKHVLYPLMDSLEIKRGKHTHGFHIFRHTAATVLHELTGDIEKAQKALGHAHRSTTESFYDHAENVVDAETTGLLLGWLVGEDHELLQHSDTVN